MKRIARPVPPAQTNKCPATLKPSTNCVIQVVFTPPNYGNFNATLWVTDGDKSSPQTASFSGVGLGYRLDQ